MNNLLTCPNCAKLGKKQILGRMMEGGQFLVLRFHHGTTIVQATEAKIICGCGYEFNVSSGTVVTQTA